jgi:hypothetical protein
VKRPLQGTVTSLILGSGLDLELKVSFQSRPDAVLMRSDAKTGHISFALPEPKAYPADAITANPSAAKAAKSVCGFALGPKLSGGYTVVY